MDKKRGNGEFLKGEFMNKKIAILTLYYHNYNYGGLLQAYALQKAIEKLGYQAEQISYILESGYVDWNPMKARIKKPLANIYHWIKYGKWFEQYIVRCKKIENFAASIPHTEVVTAQTISKLNDSYDCFVCGSDQIWNPIGWQPTLFFEFLSDDTKRISYAASVARDKLSEAEYAFMQPYLDKFSVISVREKNTAEMLNQKFPSLDVQAVPDPVFLLTEEEWRLLIPKEKDKEECYIFAYFLGESKENIQKVIQYAANKRMKIRFASYLDYTKAGWEEENSELLTGPLGVEEFLQNIANAEIVLTDSFHAAAFSSIFKTPFYTLPRFKNEDCNSMNSRIFNLLQQLGIMERYTEKLPIEYRWLQNERDYIDQNIAIIRRTGMRYLKEALH